jgi:histidinol-phosphate aminotransferase
LIALCKHWIEFFKLLLISYLKLKRVFMVHQNKSYRHTYAPAYRTSIDLSLSENPLGPSPKVAKAILNALESAHLYPHEEEVLIAEIAKHHQIAENHLFLGAGANQLLEDILKVFALRKNIVVPSIGFPESIACMKILQGEVIRVPLNPDLSLNPQALLEAVNSDTAFIHLCNPNNPTGIWMDPRQLLRLADQSPVPLLISEAGADFVGQTSIDSPFHSNLIVVRSFSKAYGLAGLRIGYVVAAPELIAKMKYNLVSYRVNSFALAAALAALKDQKHLQKSIAYQQKEKIWLMREMEVLGFKIIPAEGQNFIAQVPASFESANHFCEMASAHGIAVVNCSLYEGLHHYIRVSPKKRETNKKFILILKKITKEK